MASEDFYRDAARRTHRTLGSYLVQWAWTNLVDCVVVERTSYLRFVDLKIMPTKRVRWFTDDLQSIFSHAVPRRKAGKWSSIYLSRHQFPPGFPWGSMSTKERIKKLNNAGLRSALVRLPDDKTVVEAMARVAAGLEDFGDAPWST